MDTAVKFTELENSFAKTVNGQIAPGRRFDRVMVNGSTKYFVDRNSWAIFGAKSSFQYNPRRAYGTLETVDQYDWTGDVPVPVPGTAAERLHNEREARIIAGYKPRGRPRKVAVTP